MHSLLQRLLDDVQHSSELRSTLTRIGWSDADLSKLTGQKPPVASDDRPTPKAHHKRVVLYTDGACRGNPGPSSAGWVIEEPDGSLITQAGVYLGTGTNNEAEYSAAILGLQDALERGAQHIVLRADSELMIKQLKGQYRVKNERLKPLFEKLVGILSQFETSELEHVKRHLNQAADRQANLALDDQR